MARIYPFRALRYNPSQVRLQDVVTQPYDKITPGMQQKYYDRSPYNLVRIILGLPELFDNEQNNVYTRAAASFTAWRKAGVLAAENDPAVFAYAQRYTVPGTSGVVRERRGFIALGQLYDYAQNVVFRHEQTLSKPKSDRMNLLQATRAHCEQIYMLYSDPSYSTENILFAGNSVPDLEVTDDYGVSHRLWKVTDPGTINILCSAMEDKKLIIADGHHRYETALAYSKECAPPGADAPGARSQTGSQTSNHARPAFPEAAVMMTFVNMDAEGITILPTHRVVFGLDNFDAAEFLAKAEPFFDIKPITTQDAAEVTQQLVSAGQKTSRQTSTAFVAVTRQGRHLLTAKKAAVDAALAAIPARQRQLDVVQLHGLVLEQLLGITPEAIREQRNLRYLREASEAMEQVASADAQIAFLINPVTLDQLREVAFAGEVMPQKSTDFYPKLLSGLTFYALD